MHCALVFLFTYRIFLKTSSFGENNIMNTKPCMFSHNKRIVILIYTKDCSDTEGYKNQTNFVAQKMAASEVLSAQCINRTLKLGRRHLGLSLTW